MSSICWPSSGFKALKRRDFRRSIYLSLAFAGLWSINLLIVFFGLPILIYSRLKQLVSN